MTTTTPLRTGPTTLEAVELALFGSRPAVRRNIHPSHPEYAKEPVLCTNPASWHPTLWVVQRHHHPALSWRRELLEADPDVDTSWWKLFPYCGLCHDAEHTLLNMHVRAGEPPPWSVRRTFGLYVRDNVAEAWKFRPAITPYT